MLKYLYIALFIFIISYKNYSQNKSVKQKKYYSWCYNCKIISFGLGAPVLNPFYFRDIKKTIDTTIKVTNTNNLPVMHAKFEFALSNNFGLGICVNRSSKQFYQSYTSNLNKIDLLTVNVFNINVRGNYHFLHKKVIDPYVGFGAGIRKITLLSGPNKIDVNENKRPFGLEFTIGIRYLIKSTVGVYFEAGVGRSFYQGGISFNIAKHKYPATKDL